ncbi:hypothetical protein EF919_28345 [Streptomyces sp. WAC02707]|nr:hypothetical protein DBP22_03380 [Streptomyces sp. CS207]RSS89183.1 hypothetical protein EF919_28345 [Streptomyces sp. WAC02707]
MGRGAGRGPAGAVGRREHTPSSVATSCDYGILPFGLGHSGGTPCQNRITGDPPNRTRPVQHDRTFTGIPSSSRKIFGIPRNAETVCRRARLSRLRRGRLSRGPGKLS